MNWNSYYVEQAGYGTTLDGFYKGASYQRGYGTTLDGFYKGAAYQRGYGLGGTFRRFFKWIVPLVQKHALPTLERGAKAVGKEALSTFNNIATDVLAGKNMKDSTSQHVETAVGNLKNQAEQALEGKGIKRRRKFKNRLYLKKRRNYQPDIFD